MPLRCLSETGQNIHAFDVSSVGWDALAKYNRKARQLRMPCCMSEVTLRRSSRGTQFFAHKAVGSCQTAPETEVHLRLKQIAVEAARVHGWAAETEIAGVSPEGDGWQADVLASRKDLKIAIEIQWSSQTTDETLRRQERYRKSGIRCLWIMRKPGLPVTRELPTAEIVDNGTEPLRVRLSSGQIVPITEFLNAAFGGRFKFGAPLGVSAMVAVRAGPLHCWHNACHAQTTIVTGVDVVFGPNLCTFSVKELGLHPDLFDVIHGRIPTNRQMGALKKRYSKTQDGSYLSNGCYRCDRIIGEFFEHDAYGEQVVVCEFPIRLSEPWRKAIDLHYGYDDSWAVYAPDGGSLPGLIERQPSIIP